MPDSSACHRLQRALHESRQRITYQPAVPAIVMHSYITRELTDIKTAHPSTGTHAQGSGALRGGGHLTHRTPNKATLGSAGRLGVAGA